MGLNGNVLEAQGAAYNSMPCDIILGGCRKG